MTRTRNILVAAALLAVPLMPISIAQGPPQTVILTLVDPIVLATGYRVSKVVGSTVVNELGDKVGTIDDLIITPNDKVPYAVLSVGGFLGVGVRYVVVLSSSLEVKDNQMLLRGATKEALLTLPEFVYSY
jgi:hypothetical protein